MNKAYNEDIHLYINNDVSSHTVAIFERTVVELDLWDGCTYEPLVRGKATYRLASSSRHALRTALLPRLIALQGQQPVCVLRPVDASKPQVAFFDLDNTLIATELMVELGMRQCADDTMRRLTLMTMSGAVPFSESFICRVAMLTGLPVSELDALTQDMPVIPDLAQVLSLLNCSSYIVSGAFRCFSEALAHRYPAFCGVTGTSPEIIGGRLTGRLSDAVVGPEDKAAYVRQISARCGVENRLAVGDGANDVPMLCETETAILYNASAQAQSTAPILLSRVIASLMGG